MNKKQRGIFITFEGLECAGKTSAIEWSKEYLRHIKTPIVWTREPGGTELGINLRKIVLEQEVAPAAELFLYFADRVQHVQDVIKPALARGEIVVCDRYIDSTYAYQGFGRQHGFETIRHLESCLAPVVLPNFTLLLKISPATCLARLNSLRTTKDRFEQLDSVFFERVAAGYDHVQKNALLSKNREFITLDAEQPLKSIQEQLARFWDKLIETNNL